MILATWRMRQLAIRYRAQVDLTVRERGWNGDEVWSARATIGRVEIDGIGATPGRALDDLQAGLLLRFPRG